MKLVLVAALICLSCRQTVVVDVGGVRPNYEAAARSVVRLRVPCDGEVERWGSGTVISPYVVVTAAHMECDEGESTFEAVLFDGGVVHLVSGPKAGYGVDVMLLESLGGRFEHWAEIASADPVPLEHVYGITGDGVMDTRDYPEFFLKHGYVAKVLWNKIFVSVHCVPGNSGSGWFNDRGELVGVLSAGIWESGMENWCVGYRPASWLHLISP